MTWFKAALAVMLLNAGTSVARSEIGGHGPDGWRVTGVSVGDVLNARMGPGTNYPVIETFAHSERALQQITCVPFYTAAHFMAMSEAQIVALPPRWCLMRDAAMRKAGWVAQRFITPDNAETAAAPPPPRATPAKTPATNRPEPSGNTMIAAAEELVREIYERYDLALVGASPDPLDPAMAANFFSDDIVAFLASGRVQAHPLFGAQDFDSAIEEPRADPDQPMLRGMITINVDFTNFGQPQRAVFLVRADTTRSGSPLRIFRIEHDGWSLP
jgi:hypothetical protein